MKKNKSPYSDKAKKDSRILHLNPDTLWIIEVTILAFIISLVLSIFSDIVISNSTALISLIVLIVFIGLGIIFDMVGIAVTVADSKIFNSMASKKVRGAKTALNFIKNKSKVSSFCNDVIGDICGILSGSAGVTIALTISKQFSFNLTLTTLIVTSIVAALTIGGKAIGKSIAINKSNGILYIFSKIIDIITFKKA